MERSFLAVSNRNNGVLVVEPPSQRLIPGNEPLFPISMPSGKLLRAFERALDTSSSNHVEIATMTKGME